MRNSLRTRLTISFIALATIPLILVGAVLAVRSFTVQRQQALSSQQQIAQRVAVEVETFIRERENELRFLTEIRGVQRLDREQQTNLLTGLLSYQGVYDELALLDNQGQEQIRLSALEIVTPDQLGNRSGMVEFVKATGGETYFSSVQFNEDTGEPFMTIAVPLFDLRSGDFTGMLVANFRFKTVWDLMRQAQLAGSGNVYVVSESDNKIIAHRNPSVVQQETQFNPPEEAGFYIGLDGTDVALAVEHIELGSQKFDVVAEILASEASALAVNAIYVTIGAIIIALIIAGGLGFLAARQIMQPVEAMSTTVQAISAGDLSQQVEVSGRDELGELAMAFNNMTIQLRHSIDTLEERVEQRTQAMKTTAEISRRVTAILDIDELLQYVVDSVKIEFDLYYTQVYLLDEETNNLIMAQGSGHIGQRLKAHKHILQVGEGIVGVVASTNEYFLSNNVNEVPNFVRNPLLPNTNSELAVPLHTGEQVLGVLDVQATDIDRFAPDDVTLMQSLANQVAITLNNANLVTETRTALEKVERLHRSMIGEGWGKTSDEILTAGYRFIGGGNSKILPTSDAWLPPMTRAAAAKQLVKQTQSVGNGDETGAELAVPLMLRGEVIGVLGVKRKETPEWDQEEVSAVEAVANQVARALENARLAKEQLKTIGQLKEIDRLKSEFLTSMSHELRTPLNSIIGFADVIIQGIDGEIPDMAMNDVSLIHNSGQHLLALINDILDISKIEAGMMELVREPLDVHESVEDVFAASTSLVRDKPVQILTDVPDDLPLVYADKLRLNQILLNLVSNGAKFTHEGSITINVDLLEDRPDRMYISIIDTGIGIPEDKQDAIFDRFRQADSTTTREYGGTGLGLAICKQLIELHDGQLGLKSEVGVGSEFYFTVPLARDVPDG